MVRKHASATSPNAGELASVLQVLEDINQKMSYLIEQLRNDLYILVPRDKDAVFGGPARRKNRR